MRHIAVGLGQDINFMQDETSISVNSSAMKVDVNCGVGSCTGGCSASFYLLDTECSRRYLGTWNWGKLIVNGGVDGPINNFTGIEDYTQ